MFKVIKTLEISAAHKLTLNYESKCSNLHGHNWLVKVYCKSETLDENGMVVDFTHIYKNVCDKLDHKYINDVLPCNPTAENIAKWISEQVPHCYKVEVQESEGNVAVYEQDI